MKSTGWSDGSRWKIRSAASIGSSIFWDRVTLHPASLESYPGLFRVISQHKFDECYHLAAQSFVAESFADGFSTMKTNINGTYYMMAALRELHDFY